MDTQVELAQHQTLLPWVDPGRSKEGKHLQSSFLQFTPTKKKVRCGQLQILRWGVERVNWSGIL